MGYRLLLFVLFSAGFVASCSPSQYVVPLKAGEQAISASLGGPLITYSDAVIPAPMITVGYGNGLDSNLTLFGNGNITSALFGVIQTEAGIRYGTADEPEYQCVGYTGGLSFHTAIDVWEGNFKVWPEVAAAIHHPVSLSQDLSLRPYFSLSTWIELATKRAHDQPQEVHFLPSVASGLILSSTRWDYGVEARLIAPGSENRGYVAEYHGLSGNGAFGVYLSIGRRFGL
jgi:hypothetical protein